MADGAGGGQPAFTVASDDRRCARCSASGTARPRALLEVRGRTRASVRSTASRRSRCSRDWTPGSNPGAPVWVAADQRDRCAGTRR